MDDKEQLQLAIGKRVKMLREEKGIAQQDLAAKCKIEKSNLSLLEADGTNPTLYTLKRIADNLGIGLCDIVNLEAKN
ncbi:MULTISPECIES: helix-turn-helix domain-containing protein [Bizionia]|uniref:Helix-turn-helix transcriptional regulator n=1 Tax=Bizionia algoritergicola TaxID=291187 RepID=A0A5D0R252_9FLAO|nr:MULTISPECIES: helix-turn-helix transcriptional regulator [Bizionia]OBX24228.1 transcriptional regulator [Bizionia sp. APA-3]TYB75149.1 helix-turn-helix transcriptional regulator [Bizionia algoritergicola]